jgi:DNA transformation protein and related proteins
MRNLGPQMQRWLKEVDINTAEDLKHVGAVAAYGRLRFMFGKQVSIIALYAMQAALIGCDWRSITVEEKTALRKALETKP